MTQIKIMPAPVRRPGALGIHSLDGICIAVPDLARAEGFYRDFGLDVRQEGNGLGLYTHGHPHRWAHLVEGPAKKLSHLSFGCYEADFASLTANLAAHGVQQLDPPPGFASNGVWFQDPDGTWLELRVAEKTSPDEKSRVSNPSSPPGVQGSVARSKAPFIRPRRLAHVLIYCRDVPRAIRFYAAVLGLRLSDQSPGIAFMHGVHGSDHHLLALAESNGPGLHHLSWDVGSIHEIGLGARQMADRGHSAGWGLGRHVLGSNYFHYVRDPWGSYSEYSSDIDYIPATHDWESANHPAEDAFYVWGPVPPDDFNFNYEAAP